MGDDCVRFLTVMERSRLAGGCASLSDKCSSDVESLSSSEINIQRCFFVRHHERFYVNKPILQRNFHCFLTADYFSLPFCSHLAMSPGVFLLPNIDQYNILNTASRKLLHCACVSLCVCRKDWRQIMDPLGKTLPYSIVFLVCCSAIVDQLCSLIVWTVRILKWSDPVEGPILCSFSCSSFISLHALIKKHYFSNTPHCCSTSVHPLSNSSSYTLTGWFPATPTTSHQLSKNNTTIAAYQQDVSQNWYDHSMVGFRHDIFIKIIPLVIHGNNNNNYSFCFKEWFNI